MRGLPDLTSMAFFIRIVDEGSIIAAGRALGLPKATVSRRLAMLEERIGAPLIARSTRAISLTDAGRRFYERIGPLIREAEAAQSEMVDASAAPSGLLRVTASIVTDKRWSLRSCSVSLSAILMFASIAIQR
jgi:DNA-binding transcriptional LysR family regulator